MEPSEQQPNLSFRDYLRVLRSRRKVIILSVLVVAVTALVSAELQTPTYQATASVLLKYQSAAQSLFNPATGQPNDPTRQVQNQLQVITSQPIKQAVKAQLGVAADVVVVPVGQTDVINISAQNTDPVAAATIANTYAGAYINSRRTQNVNDALASAAQIQDRINSLQKDIDGINAQIGAATPKNQAAVSASLTPQLQSLAQQQGTFRQQLASLQVDAALNSGDAQLVTPAKTPATPSSPRPLRDLILAILAGLVLGVGAALVVDQLDDSVKSPEDLVRAVHNVPNLTVIPHVSAWRTREEPLLLSLSDPKSPGAEAYRSLRTSIQFAALDRPLHTLQITSASQGEGKTTTLANLGVALAQVGQRVIITCCDLRRPRLHEFFGLDNSVGFTSVLLGDVPVSDALQDVPGINGLKILASGPPPPNPAELLASSRTAEVLLTLQSLADIVLVDSPPVLPVTDAAIISGVVDVTLLVVTAGSTTRRQAAQAVHALIQVDAPLLGTVLNGVRAADTYGSTYGYYYRYETVSPRRLDLGARLRRGTDDQARSEETLDA